MGHRDQVVITGSAGFIGSYLLYKLSLGTRKVVSIDKGMYGTEHIKPFLHDGITHINKPLSDALGDVDWAHVECVVHLSGLSNDPLADFNLEANRKLNTLDSINLAHVCADQKVPKFVFASSASVYGMEDDKLSHESDHVYPYSNYAKSKREAEVAFLEMHGLHPVILRKGTVMGVSPRMRFDLVVNTMMKEATQFKKIRLLGGGENWRPLVDIRDVVELYHSIIMMSQDEYDKVSGNIYNVVGENFRISELGLRIGSLLDVPVVPDYSLPRDVRSYRLDGGLAEAKLHFKPQHKLVSTVRDIEGWIRSRSPDFEDPIYYNIKWIKACQRVCNIIGHDYDITQ